MTRTLRHQHDHPARLPSIRTPRRGRATSPVAPQLIAAAHGTADPAGAEAVRLLLHLARAARPGLEITVAYLSKGTPTLADALAEARARGRRPIVVPLLLSSGYHVRHDIRRAAAAVDAPVARHLGPDPLVVELLARRLRPLLGGGGAARVVLAAAGSRDPRAAEETGRAAQLLSARLGLPVSPAYVTTTAPSLEEAMAGHCDVGHTVAATYLLAPGEFERRVARAAGGAATAPLAPHPLLARLLLARYDEVVAADLAGLPGPARATAA